jgi:phosphoribosyl-ATP pyrophosphohydrolase
VSALFGVQRIVRDRREPGKANVVFRAKIERLQLRERLHVDHAETQVVDIERFGLHAEHTKENKVVPLERTLVARRRKRPAGSYTVELLENSKLAGEKVREEAAEVVKAVNSESEERVAEEGADVVYHLAVLLLSRGVSMAEVLHVLNGRRRAR